MAKYKDKCIHRVGWNGKTCWVCHPELLKCADWLLSPQMDAAYIAEKSVQQSDLADGLCLNCGKDYFVEETIVDGELKCSCTIR